MTDEELMAMARLAQRDERMSTGALYGDLADRIEALTKELEAYAEEVEAENKMLRDAVYIDDLTVTMQASDRSKAIEGIGRALDLLNVDMVVEARAALRATLAEISSHNKGESHD